MRNETYTPENFNEQLEDQNIELLRDIVKNKVEGWSWILSRILLWYKGDFEIPGGVKKRNLTYFYSEKFNE